MSCRILQRQFTKRYEEFAVHRTYRFPVKRLHVFIKGHYSTVGDRYFTRSIFSANPSNSHPIARSWGRICGGLELWLIISCFIHYSVIWIIMLYLFQVLTIPDCISQHVCTRFFCGWVCFAFVVFLIGSSLLFTHIIQGPVLLTLLRHVARILANGSAAFFESCDTIGWNSCDVSQKR